MRIGNFLRRNETFGGEPPPVFELPGTLYAVGDIHGMSGLMDGIVERILRDANRPDTRGPKTLVFMGDYIDRGDDSRGVLERLKRLDARTDIETVFLRGNHDDLMLGFVEAPLEHRQWLEWGGIQTLASFGVPPLLPGATDEDFEDAAATLVRELGDLRDFLSERTVLMHRSGNVVLCHAAMRPELPVDGQPEDVLMWGSRRFIEQGGPPGFWYVHGHTIVQEPAVVGNRIPIDTGAFGSGILSAARITREGCAFLQHM